MVWATDAWGTEDPEYDWAALEAAYAGEGAMGNWGAAPMPEPTWAEPPPPEPVMDPMYAPAQELSYAEPYSPPLPDYTQAYTPPEAEFYGGLSPEWMAFEEQQQAMAQPDMGADQVFFEDGSWRQDLGPTWEQFAQDEAAAGMPDLWGRGVRPPSILNGEEFPQQMPTQLEIESRIRPEANAWMQQVEAADALQRMGLPPELLSLANTQDAPRNLDWLGLYEPGRQQISLTPQTMGQTSPRTAIHESLHAFENMLPPDRANELRRLIALYPPPDNWASQHHPPGIGTGPGITGLTAYLDTLYGGTDPRFNIPTPILQFIRENTPVVLANVGKPLPPPGPYVPPPPQSPVGGGFQPLPEIVGPTTTVDHGVSGPTSAPNPIDPAWFPHEEQQFYNGLPDMGAGLFGPTLPDANLNSASQAIAAPRETDITFAQDTPFKRSQPLDPIGRLANTIGGVIPYSQQIQSAAGDVGQFVGDYIAPNTLPMLGAANMGLNLFGSSLGDVTGTAAEASVPTRWWELGLEFIPGIGMVPDAARFGPDAVRAFRQQVDEVGRAVGRVLEPEEQVRLWSGIYPSDYDTILKEGFRPGTALTPDRELADAYAMRRAQMEGAVNPVTLEFRVPKSQLVEDSYYYTSPETLQPVQPGARQGLRDLVFSEQGSVRIPGGGTPEPDVPVSRTLSTRDISGWNSYYGPEKTLREVGADTEESVQRIMRTADAIREVEGAAEITPLHFFEAVQYEGPNAGNGIDNAIRDLQQAIAEGRYEGRPGGFQAALNRAQSIKATRDGLASQPLKPAPTRSRRTKSVIPPGAAAASPPATTAGPSSSPASAAAPPIEPPAAALADAPDPDGFAGNIRLEKYPDDIQSTIKEWADANPEAVQEARRGTRDNATTVAAAQELVEDTGGDWTKLQRSWKPGEAWNAEEITAIRGALTEKTNAVIEAARLAQTDDSAVNQARLIAALADQARIQQVVHGVTAEAGRALQAFRMNADEIAGHPDVAVLRQALDQVGLDNSKITDIAKKLTNGELNTPVKVNNFIRNVTKPTMWDYITEVWINALLSSPKTHIINALSNTVNALSSPIERGFAAAVDIPLSRVQKRARARFFSEVTADAFGLIEGVPEGLRASLSVLKSGDALTAGASKIEMRRQAFKGPIGTLIRAPGTALETADAWFYTLNYRAALNSSIIRQARGEGLKGDALVNRIAELKANPTEALTKSASQTANYRVFRGDPGSFTRDIMRLTSKYPALKIVVPFLRTPVNILKYGIERSPVGLLSPQLRRNLMNGSPEAADQLGRIVMGSGIAAAIAYGVAEGNITGAVPDNATARDRFFREGKLPFAVKVGGTWIQFQRLEPFNQTLSQIAALAESGKKGASLDKTAAEVATAIGVNLVNQSYLTGISNLLNAMKEPDRYGSDWVSRLASSFIPGSSALRTAAQATDSTVRRPEGTLETIKANIPGLSSSVPSRLDAFGNEVERTTPAWSPIQIAPDRQSQVDAELEALGIEVGFVGNSIGGNTLSRYEQHTYQKMAGQMTEMLLERLVVQPDYIQLTPEERAQQIDGLIADAREPVRDVLETVIESEEYQDLSNKERRELMERLSDRWLVQIGVSR